jgi:hypothetical protein
MKMSPARSATVTRSPTVSRTPGRTGEGENQDKGQTGKLPPGGVVGIVIACVVVVGLIVVGVLRWASTRQNDNWGMELLNLERSDRLRLYSGVAAQVPLPEEASAPS